jgi:peptidoglycan hydrolase-like protein with peptidoglycan-binding domain
MSRNAIRGFQKKAGIPADGYAEYGLLELVRRTPRP